jgi:hypothetical protein
MSIQIESEVIETISPGPDIPRAAPGKKPGATIENARTGYKAVTYKMYYDRAGNLIGQAELCRSTYPSSGRIYASGP